MEMIHFVYHDAVSPSASESLEDLGALVVLSDRFDVASAKSFCVAQFSRRFSAEQTPAQALQVLSLPSLLHTVPSFKRVLSAAKAAIQKVHGPALLPSAAADDLKNLRRLPQVGLEVLLECSTLDVPSEDCVLQGGLTWARAHTSIGRDRLEFLAEVLLPRLRLPFLSTTAVSALVQEVTTMLRNVGPSCEQDEPLRTDETCLKGWVARRVEGCTKDVPQEVSNFVAASQLAHCLELMRAAGVQVPASVLKWCETGAHLLQPRLGYLPPDGTLHLCIPYGDCTDSKLPDTATSSFATTCGRWVAQNR